MDSGRRTRPREPVYIAAVGPALQAGAVCGGVGFVFGSVSGVIRGAPALLFASASGIQTFGLGSLFFFTRAVVVDAWTPNGQVAAPRDLTKASALAGGFSGGVLGFLARGRSNALPGAIMFTIFGAGGQHIYNRWTAPKDFDAKPKENFWKRMSEKSWTPFRVLSNEEYAEMLREKVIKLDVEIAVLDDKIVGLKEQQSREEAEAALGSSTTSEQRHDSK